MELKSTARRRAGEAGFSMVEALIASAILLIIAIGMIPLFARSMVNNALGSDYTQATAHGMTGLEESANKPFQSVDLLPATGASSMQRVQYVGKGMQSGSPVSDPDWQYSATGVNVLWTRTLRVRTFKVTALDDGRLTDDEFVPVSADLGAWDLMEVTEFLDSGKSRSGVNASGLASIRQTNFQYLKAF